MPLVCRRREGPSFKSGTMASPIPSIATAANTSKRRSTYDTGEYRRERTLLSLGEHPCSHEFPNTRWQHIVGHHPDEGRRDQRTCFHHLDACQEEMPADTADDQTQKRSKNARADRYPADTTHAADHVLIIDASKGVPKTNDANDAAEKQASEHAFSHVAQG